MYDIPGPVASLERFSHEYRSMLFNTLPLCSNLVLDQMASQCSHRLRSLMKIQPLYLELVMVLRHL